jgi:hypothetical protein
MVTAAGGILERRVDDFGCAGWKTEIIFAPHTSHFDSQADIVLH